MMTLSGGAAVIEPGDFSEREGTRSFRIPISKSMGAHQIAQYVSRYGEGVSLVRRNPAAEEVAYVIAGSGICYIDGYSYTIEPGTAIFIPPGSSYQFENLDERGRRVNELEIVSVCCPEVESEVGIDPMIRTAQDTKPFRTLRETDQPVIPTGDRTFRLLINQDIGAQRVTQFAGVIPPGRAPMHHHTYEEAIYVIEGEGRVWTKDGTADFGTGCSIYLPRTVSHCLENTGTRNIRLLGVFHPSGSPAVRYDD